MVVVWGDAGASGAQYLLGGYSVSTVTPGGVLKVQNLTSTFFNGRLQAAFTLAQATPTDGSVPIIVAVRMAFTAQKHDNHKFSHIISSIPIIGAVRMAVTALCSQNTTFISFLTSSAASPIIVAV
jgi:hypothetical protein